MSLEMQMAKERANQLLADAENYRRAKQARAHRKPSAWTRLFTPSRWGGSHARRGQLM